MKYILILVFILTGCSAKTVEEVEKAKQYCDSHNLTLRKTYDTRSNRVFYLQCQDKDGLLYPIKG